MTGKKEEKEDIPQVEVPDKYQPYEDVSVDRKNQKYFIDSKED